MPVEILCLVVLLPAILGFASFARRGSRPALAILLITSLVGLGLLSAGGPAARSLPAADVSAGLDALARGRLGWMFLLLPIFIILSPLWMAAKLRGGGS